MTETLRGSFLFDKLNNELAYEDNSKENMQALDDEATLSSWILSDLWRSSCLEISAAPSGQHTHHDKQVER